MLKNEDVNEFVEFGLKTNIMLTELKEYTNTGYGSQRKWLRNYAKQGIETLGRMYRLLSLLGQKDSDRYTFYNIEKDGGKYLLPGFVVRDFADPRAPLMRVNNAFAKSLTDLFNYILEADKEIVMLAGFTIDMPESNNKQHESHANGRAVDILLGDMTPEASFQELKIILDKHPELNILIIEYPKWVHIERRGNSSFALALRGRHITKSCNQLMKLSDI